MTGTDHRVVHQVSSWCLSYPDDELLGRIDMLRAAMSGLPRRRRAVPLLQGFLDHLATTDTIALRRQYIDLFDLSRRHTLFLTYWTDGDTRRRGASLGEFARTYRESGHRVDLHGELPDHLPVLLEFTACVDPAAGLRLLEKHRAALDSLNSALESVGTPYADVVAAVRSTLGRRRRSPVGDVTTPPIETVGLEPFDRRLLPIAEAR